MYGDVVPFLFEEKHLLRSVVHHKQPWFAGSDVAEILGYRDASNALRSLDDDEKGTHILSTPGGQQEITIVSEPGLYRCIIQRRSVAKLDAEIRRRIVRFQRWTFHEVLPSIRRTGHYGPSTSGEPPRLEYPRPFHEWSPADKNANCAIVSRYQQAMGPQVAQWSMEILGFPMPPEHLRSRQFELDLHASRPGECS